QVNVADITFLITRIFSGGAAPVPEEAGDANGSGSINVADITYLITRIFAGGAAPVCP
ncbi:MAG: dockerin type I domain-containing protein, partial [Candidatus Zixiibacteriota bacterium]